MAQGYKPDVVQIPSLLYSILHIKRNRFVTKSGGAVIWRKGTFKIGAMMMTKCLSFNSRSKATQLLEDILVGSSNKL